MLFGSVAQLLALAVAFLIAIDVHEFSHAWMANELGDSTARYQGRLTLNPLAHLDPLGTIMIFVAGFGWGKPVPVNPYALRNGPRAGMAMTSFAGPLANLITAVVFAVPIRLGLVRFAPWAPGILPGLDNLISIIVYLNIALAVFNLIPIAPLDGFAVAVGLLPYQWAYTLKQWEQYGPAVLLLLLMLGRWSHLDILGWIMRPFIEVLLWLIVG